MKLTLLGNPKTTQNCYRYACRGRHPAHYMTGECSALKEDYQWQARAQYHGQPLTEALKLTVELFFGSKRKVDWDNFHKLSMDALTGIVWLDDSQVEEAHVYKRYDKANPRIELTIEPYDAK